MPSENEWVETAHETGNGATRNGDGDPSAESRRTCRKRGPAPGPSAKKQLSRVAVIAHGDVSQCAARGLNGRETLVPDYARNFVPLLVVMNCGWIVGSCFTGGGRTASYHRCRIHGPWPTLRIAATKEGAIPTYETSYQCNRFALSHCIEQRGGPCPRRRPLGLGLNVPIRSST